MKPDSPNLRIKIAALWHALITWIRSLFKQPDPVVSRLNQLRRLYGSDPAAAPHYRQFRDVLRGHVAPEYHPYYDRLLRMEKATIDLLRHQPTGKAVPDASALLSSVCALTERTARLIEQLQQGDQLAALYPKGSSEQQMVITARQRLIARIDETIALQESLPARLMQLSTASTGRSSDRLRETLADLSSRLEGMAESYDEMSSSSFWLERSHSQNKERS